jgi:hypothetical protein
VSPSYDGPHLPSPITMEFALSMIEHFKKDGTLHRKYGRLCT